MRERCRKFAWPARSLLVVRTPGTGCGTRRRSLNHKVEATYGPGMPSTTPLGQYLRARRALVRPQDVGFPCSGARRVPGLRREELAMLAGISPSYYLRLEQGRDQRPSRQVIDALARALQLDEDATVFLHSLTHPTSARCPNALRDSSRRSLDTDKPERAPSSIEQLIASWDTTPAMVHNRHLDVLAANRLALALCPAFSPGANCLRALFLDPGMRSFYGDWEDVARSAVARLRGLVGPDLDDARLTALVSNLSEDSPDFRGLWARQDIQLRPAHPQVFNNPIVGPIELQPERLAIVGTNGQMLVVRHARPGSVSERALLRLANLIADKPPAAGGSPSGRSRAHDLRSGPDTKL